MTHAVNNLVLLLVVFSFGCSEKKTGSITTISTEDRDSLIARLNDPIKLRRMDSLRLASIDQVIHGTPDNVAFYEKAMKIDSNNFMTRIRHAYAISEFNHDTVGAIKELRETLKMYPNAPDVWFALGTLFFSINQDSGSYYCERSIQMNPSNYFNSYCLAKYYEAYGKDDKALVVVEKAIKEWPTSVDLKLFRASFRLSTRDYEGAYNDMVVIPEKFSDDASVYFNRAKASLFLKKYKETVIDCNTALRLGLEGVSLPEVYLIRGTAIVNSGDIDSGYLDIKKSFEMGNPDAVEAYKKLNEYYRLKKSKRH